MAATQSFAIPLCSIHKIAAIRNDSGQWVCATCADEWLKEFVDSKTGDKSKGGVKLPWGVKDERKKTPSFRDLTPNRAARRRARRA